MWQERFDRAATDWADARPANNKTIIHLTDLHERTFGRLPQRRKDPRMDAILNEIVTGTLLFLAALSVLAALATLREP
jgi:hypothetical protein